MNSKTVTIETGFRKTLTGNLWTAGWNTNVMRQKKRKNTPWEILCFDYPFKILQIIWNALQTFTRSWGTEKSKYWGLVDEEYVK